jgi:hypothetical protein
MSSQQIRAGKASIELGVQDKLQAGLKLARQRLDNFAKSAAKVGGGLVAAGAAITAPLAASVKVFADVGDQLDKMAARTGMSVENLSALGFAANRSGTDLESIEKASRKLSQNFGELATGSAAAQQKFGALGLSLEDLQGKSPDQMLDVVFSRLARIEDPALRAAMAMEIFGKSGANILPMLSAGMEGLEGMRQEASALGLVMSRDAATSAAAITDAMGDFWATVKGVSVQLGAAVAGPLTTFFRAASHVVASVSQWIGNNQELIQIIGAVGLALTAAGAAILGVAGTATALSFALGGVGTAIAAAGAVIGAMLSPVGLVLGAVAGVAAALLMWTDVLDPVIDYLTDGFNWLVGLVQQTIGGISDALMAGDIGLAAQIGFAGLKLAATTALESVLGIFGSSIGSMSKMLAELWKQIGSVVARLNEARANVSQWLAKAGGWVVGVTVEDGDNADLMNARAWSQSMRTLDTDAITSQIAGALSPETYADELAGLMAQAREARAAAEAAAGPSMRGFDAGEIDIEANSAAMKKAEQFSSIGSFAAANIAKQLPGAKSKDDKLIANTGNMVTELKGLRSDLAGAPGLTFG